MREPGKYFTWAELTQSRTASLYGISNKPTPEDALALVALVANVLDPLREFLGRPLELTSAYRSPELNARIGGSRTSQHMKGEAVDAKTRGMDAAALARAVLTSGVPFDQLIWYAPSRGGHIHVSYKANGVNRGQILHAADGGGFTSKRP